MSPVNNEFRLMNDFMKKIQGEMELSDKVKATLAEVVAFRKKHGRFPYNRSTDPAELKLAYTFNNYCAPKSKHYFPEIREWAISMGRTPSNKPDNNKPRIKREILKFIKEHGHAPRNKKTANSKKEVALAARLYAYTHEDRDMTFLGKVYQLDQCHRTYTRVKHRAKINKALKIANISLRSK